jgi:predicted P-loop ATPase
MLKHKEIKKKKENEKGKSRQHLLLEIKDYLDLKYEFRKNELTHEMEVRPLDKEEFVLLDEAFINSIWFDLQIDGYKCSDKTLLKIVNSKLTREYNPLKAYFETLPQYDGKTDYISQLAETITIEDISVNKTSLQNLWRPYLEKWLVASVATAIGKGINHLCLVLVGGQGKGKTTWLNKLCPESMKEFLVCSHINPSLTDQNTANFLAEKWFVNIDDQLETIFGKDFNSMKAIITAPFVTNRKTWHRFTQKRKRVCSFMGSVNSPKFLTDIENRRYLVFTTKEINFHHNINIENVWSQALHLFENGFSYWFTQEEMKQLNQVNELYRQVSPEEEYEPCEPTNAQAKFVMPSEILARLNANSGMKLSIKKLSAAMDTLGYGNAISKRINGSPRKVYAVIERSDMDEETYQQEIKKEFASQTAETDPF